VYDTGYYCAGGTLTPSIDQTTFTCDDVGPNTVTLTVDDGSGNSSTCTAIVTIEEDSTCTAVENVPTVGEWGLIMLALLMSITAVVGIRQRREEEVTA